MNPTLKPGYDLVYLAACALSGETPSEARMETMDFPAVFELAQRHLMSAITYGALERYILSHESAPITPQLLLQWMQARNAAVQRSAQLDAKRENLLGHLEALGCWYMPLKGVILRERYPQPQLRQMSDNDILFDAAFRAEVRTYFTERDYRVLQENSTHHDVYAKSPCVFEMHVTLIDGDYHPDLADYYADVKARLLPADGTEFGYRFRDEDFYIYFIVHAYKHAVYGGNGIRFLMDLVRFARTEDQHFDRAYVARELERLGLSEFTASTVNFALRLFDGAALTEEDEKALAIYLESGAFGTPEMIAENRFRRTEASARFSKLKYFWSRVFPGMTHIRKFAPFFYRHKILIPFYIIGRFFRHLFTDFGGMTRELKTILKFHGDK